ncbi:carbohydrate ABC transporter permease [Lichenibacterium minor]|nr:sugar ABC transporter permease [Lichenibacterium minor]
MLPAGALLLAMTVVPTLYLAYCAFRHEDLLGPNSRWVGLENFRHVLGDPNIWADALTTLQFVALAVAVEMALGLGLALMLSRKLAETDLLTALFILPLGVTPVVSALVFRVLLDPAYGWVDYYLQSWGLIDQPIDWFGEPFYAWTAVIGLDVWQWTPFVALILLAGLQGVPSEPKEAARLDGANALQLFWHIILPFMAPFLAIALVFRAIEAFKTFGSVFVLTGGGPGTSTSLINLDLYRIALQNFDIGAAAALGICFLVVLSLIMGRLLAVLNRNTDILED